MSLSRLADSWLCSLALAFVTAPSVQAQVPKRTDSVALGSVAGVVYDSLLKAPLESATVFIQGGGSIAITDREGRFFLPGVSTGRHVVAFSHDALDSLGVAGIPAIIDVVAERAVLVRLATPSYETLRATACGVSGAEVSPDSGFVYGELRDADSDSLLAGARVSVRWRTLLRPVGGRVEFGVPQLVRATSARGTYSLCGIPVGAPLSVHAFAGVTATATAPAMIERRRIARLDLFVSRVAKTTSPAGVGPSTLSGVVRGRSGVVLAGAQVSVAGVDTSVVTDEEGRFQLASLPSGTQSLIVMR
ncbi:MAG: carboxypeptidase regulatory-like domain-containing protein, partial [Gemmatimonadota bacterium]|nr:carboxypeptidase regulatory-like domain-containing protein [Gemmatimonadota bacterium]